MSNPTTAKLIAFDEARARRYITEAVTGFLQDPPDSDFQRGFLAALLACHDEALSKREEDSRITAARRLVTGHAAANAPT